MLNFFRKNTQIIVWAVVIAFVAWGAYAVSVQFEQSSRAPGKIFGREISHRDFLSTYKAVQIFTPKPADGTPPGADQLEAQTWQFLILEREAKRRKIQVTDDEVRNEITRLLGENNEMLLTPDQYRHWVQGTFREEPREFENQLRERLRVQKLFTEVKKELGAGADKKIENWVMELMRKAKIQIYKVPGR